jgi:hypothetical protein
VVTKRVYSVGGKTAVNIVSSVGNGVQVVITVASGHGFLAGEPVNITGHLVNTAANGDWRIRSKTTTTITIEHAVTGANVIGNGSGVATGTIGRKYATLQLAEADTDNNLVSLDEQIDLELCMDSASDYSLTSANAAHTFDGATTDSTRYRRIRAAPGHRFNPVDLSGVRIRKQQGSPLGTALKLAESFLRVVGIGVEVYDNGITSGTYIGVEIAAASCQLNGVWCKYTGGSGTSLAFCFGHSGSGSGTSFFNCIAVGSNDGLTGAAVGFATFNTGDLFYNCAAYGINNSPSGSTSTGFSLFSTHKAINCIAIDCVNGVAGSKDFGTTGAATVDYCISSDTSATDSPATNGYGGQSATSLWSYAAADDFRNRTTSIGLGAAKPDSSSTLGFSADFTGVTRGTCSRVR